MIYLNQAATSWPKPPCVLDALRRAGEAIPLGQQRSAGEMSARDPVQAAREILAELLHADHPARIFFTANATQAANVLIHGACARGGTILTTQAEHNSVLRPLMNQQACAVKILPCDGQGFVRLDALEEALRQGAAALFVNHMSNVTGAVQPVETIGEMAAARGVPLFLDLAQSAGSIPVDLRACRAAGAFFTGHKSLRGPQGTGGFWLAEGTCCPALLYGGTGSDSAVLDYTGREPVYEVGTQNIPALAGLHAALEQLRESGVEAAQAHHAALRSHLVEGLRAIPGATVYGGGPGRFGPVVSFTLQGLSAEDASFVLYHSFGIVTRSGLQCAPLVHQALGTQRGGVVRVSFGVENTQAEIDLLLDALRQMTGGA